MASKNIGIPIKVLHDAEGHTVTVELRNGEVFRGKLDEAEDNMNVHLSNCTKTMKDGRVQMLSKCAASCDAPWIAGRSPPRFGRVLRLLARSAIVWPRLTGAAPAPRSVFLRGSHVNFMVLPDILKNAPFFKKIDTKANKASKSGKAKQAATQRAAGELSAQRPSSLPLGFWCTPMVSGAPPLAIFMR
jgi:small nuclear ribonucleoprotein D3